MAKMPEVRKPDDYSPEELAQILHGARLDDPTEELAAHSAATQLRKRGYDVDVAWSGGILVQAAEDIDG